MLKYINYPLCSLLTSSKFSLAILSYSFYLTDTFKLLGFVLGALFIAYPGYTESYKININIVKTLIK
jgi:hypothetical protein